MKIQVLGTGCPKCKQLAENAETAARELGVEYELEPSHFCAQAQEMQFSWMKKNWDLDAWMESCW